MGRPALPGEAEERGGFELSLHGAMAVLASPGRDLLLPRNLIRPG